MKQHSNMYLKVVASCKYLNRFNSVTTGLSEEVVTSPSSYAGVLG